MKTKKQLAAAFHKCLPIRWNGVTYDSCGTDGEKIVLESLREDDIYEDLRTTEIVDILTDECVRRDYLMIGYFGSPECIMVIDPNLRFPPKWRWFSAGNSRSQRSKHLDQTHALCLAFAEANRHWRGGAS